MAYVARLKKKYNEEVAPALMQKFQYKSVMQIPRIDKIVVSVGCGDCKDNAKMLESVVKDISAITGQHAGQNDDFIVFTNLHSHALLK